MSSSSKMNHPFPDVLRIEASGKCNFRCSHCPNGHTQGKRGVMSNEVFTEIQRQTEKFIPRVVVLYHGGEPLLNQNISKQVNYFKSKGTQKVRIVTNGSLLTESIATELNHSGLDELCISFDGESPEENDAIRRGGSFHRDSENVKKALNIVNRRMKIIITNVQIMSKHNIDRYISGENVETPGYIKNKFSGYENVSFESHPAMSWPALTNCSTDVTRYAPKPSSSTSYCSNLFETFTILSNGDVVPCCYDITGESILGNILKNTMFEIWNGVRHTTFRQGLLSGNPAPICNNCVIIKHEYLVRNA